MLWEGPRAHLLKRYAPFNESKRVWVCPSITLVEKYTPFTRSCLSAIPRTFSDSDSQPVYMAIGPKDMPGGLTPRGVIVAYSLPGMYRLTGYFKRHISEQRGPPRGIEHTEVLGRGGVIITGLGTSVYPRGIYLKLQENLPAHSKIRPYLH